MRPGGRSVSGLFMALQSAFSAAFAYLSVLRTGQMYTGEEEIHHEKPNRYREREFYLERRDHQTEGT